MNTSSMVSYYRYKWSTAPEYAANPSRLRYDEVLC